jgi:hypothetical protein
MRGGTKGNKGGAKGRSGRKSKAEELGVVALLNDCWNPSDRKAVIENLVTIAQGDNAKAAVSAASLLLGYAYGKPTEKHELSGKNGGPMTLRVVYDKPRS